MIDNLITIEDLKKSAELVYANMDGSVTELLKKKESYHRLQIKFHEDRLKEIERTLDAIGETKPIEQKDYSIEDWKQISMELISNERKMFLSSEIYERKKKELNPNKRRDDIRNISLALKALCDEHQLISYKKKGIKGYIYGLPHMFEEGNPTEPKMEYRP